jgi:cation diffusion facilitator CzcD-associated flavoprotein CzcO
MSGNETDVIVIGAGPYGLAASAHLRAAGANVHVLGKPMSFWMRHMPKGMRLRSPWGASHIADPAAAWTLDEFERHRAERIERPVPLSDFVAYGHWFQKQAGPKIDARQVHRVEHVGDRFRVVLDDGEPLESARVVVAAGIAPFASRPREFDHLPAELASHSSEHDDLGRFAGRRVAVIGGGQSAFESAVLLHENGADVELIMRAPKIHWVGRATRKGFLGRLLFDRTDVGPAGVSHVVARPMLLRQLPSAWRRAAMRRSLVPGASLWLRPRSQGMAISTGRHVTAATRVNGHLELALDDASTRRVDHLLLATGYRVDVRRYGFLSPSLLAALRIVDGHPVLDAGLESSVPGLHFLGAPAGYSFGPLVRFVAGTEFGARALTRWIARREREEAPLPAVDRVVDYRTAE